MSDLARDIAALAARPEQTGLFFDFDGTLSRIVDEPDTAHAVDGAVDLLTRLAHRFRVVALISGRSVAALVERIDVPGVRLIGLYGLERRTGDTIETIPEAEAAELTELLAAHEGVVVEPKGLAVTIHFRRAPDPAQAQQDVEPIVIEVADRYGLGAPMPGRMVLELKPPVPVDKGVAVRQEIEREGLQAAMVAGDDIGDIPAFEALHGLPLGVRIAVASPESPLALLSVADHRVDSPDDLVRAVSGLLA